MTREEAIAYFKRHIEFYCVTGICREAEEMAIKALEQKPKAGCWFKTPKAVMGEGYMWYCSDCQYQVYQDKSKDYPSEKFCPNCGTKMFTPREIAQRCLTSRERREEV